MMDQRELEARVKALGKCIQANEPAANALAILNTLKKDAAPTEEMLRTTKAGVVIGKLRSHANKDIARGASELVVKWKKMVEQEKSGKGGKKTSSPTIATTARDREPGSMRPFKGNPETRKDDVDGAEIDGRTDSKVRDSCIKLLYNGLAFRSTEPVELVVARAVECEAAALEAYKGEGSEYRTKMRSLFQNLKNKDNAQLGRRVLAGDITPHKFVRMTHEELKSDERKAKDQELEKDNMKRAQVPMMEKSISDALKCGKCGQKKVSYSQAQTRSADEPMTTFCECTVCGNRWKFS